MKRAIASLALAMFVGAVTVGCEVSGKVGDGTDSSTDSTSRTDSYKKTTTVQPDGDKTVKTEVHHD